jgi:hypothetical protein
VPSRSQPARRAHGNVIRHRASWIGGSFAPPRSGAEWLGAALPGPPP